MKSKVIWIGIDPNLLLQGVDPARFFGEESFLKFNINPAATKERGEEVETLKELVRRKASLLAIPQADLSTEQKVQFRRLGDRIKKLSWKYPHIPVKLRVGKCKIFYTDQYRQN